MGEPIRKTSDVVVQARIDTIIPDRGAAPVKQEIAGERLAADPDARIAVLDIGPDKHRRKPERMPLLLWYK